MNKLYILCFISSYLIIYFSTAQAIPLESLLHDDELSLEVYDSKILSDQTQSKERLLLSEKEVVGKGNLKNSSLVPVNSMQKEQTTPKRGQKTSNNEDDFNLFEQDEQKYGLGLYETLTPVLSPEMKNDAKKVWAETADFRQAIGFSRKDSISKELILQQSVKESNLFNGEGLDGVSNKKTYSNTYSKKEPDKTQVKVLFDEFYYLLKNAFFIIAGALICGKIISIFVKKTIKNSMGRKKRHITRNRKKHRKNRCRTTA